MSGFYYRPKISAEMQQRLAKLDSHDRFHSHAIAKVDPNGHTIGSTAAPESFEQRVKKDLNREHVSQYRQSSIGHHFSRERGYKKPDTAPATPQRANTRQDARQRIDRNSSPQVSPRPNPSFQEPRSRTYNPYA